MEVWFENIEDIEVGRVFMDQLRQIRLFKPGWRSMTRKEAEGHPLRACHARGSAGPSRCGQSVSGAASFCAGLVAVPWS